MIIGSGFSGLGMAIRLKQAGRHDFVILEKAEDLGGTWRDNTYPGCACDIPSYLYSFSFAQNPRWSRMFSPQPEIFDYLKDCVRRHGLEPHLRYGARVVRALFDQTSGEWEVEVEGSESLLGRVLVAGVGALHLPRTPDLPGRETFAGSTFHSAAWRHDRDLSGQRVAVVGTGASAVQVVPAIAERVAHLDVYQRTPAWVIPKPDRPINRSERRLYERHPFAQRVMRDLVYWNLEACGAGFTVSPKLQPMAERVSRRHLEKQVPDPGLRARLTPDYQMGCKRVLPSSAFYPALQRPQVDLVTEGISCLTRGGIRDIEGTERAADTIVFATGFDVRANLRQIEIIGSGGASLEAIWDREGLNAHLGIMVSGFPNLFLLLGPNTGLGHSSVVFMIEAQVAFVLRALRLLDESGGRQIDVHAGAQRRSVRAVQKRLAGTVWQSGCRSWYLDESGRNDTIWPRSTVHYWLAVRLMRRRDYSLTGG
ncbi:MAG: hypothetical protein QOI51_440 [Nocardioidaceae bacterium]|nr:hypothetical protein [Nocardioidaceae bacterium]